MSIHIHFPSESKPQVQYLEKTSLDSTCKRIIGIIQIQCGDVKDALEMYLCITQIMNDRNALCHMDGNQFG